MERDKRKEYAFTAIGLSLLPLIAASYYIRDSLGLVEDDARPPIHRTPTPEPRRTDDHKIS